MPNPLLSFFRPKTEAKASRTAALTSLQFLSRPTWSTRDTRTLTRTGYMQNPIVYRCVRMVADTAAHITFALKENAKEHHTHPFLTLLHNPNPRQSGATLLQTLYGHLLVNGNAYLERVNLDDTPRELHALRPDLITLEGAKEGYIANYIYTVNGAKINFKQEGDVPPLLHLKLNHPLDDIFGFSPLEAATTAIDIHNATSAWTKSLLDNAARPSGALVYGGENALTDEQFTRLRTELEENFTGAKHAGRPLILEGGLDWKPMSLTPKDMDFMQAKHAAAREIALAFGIPPMLLGIPGDNSYSNYAEANRAFYRLTILPLVTRTMNEIAQWLSPAFNAQLKLEPDLDSIEALAEERDSLWKRVNDATFLSDTEKRQAVGFEK